MTGETARKRPGNSGQCEFEALEARQLLAADAITTNHPLWIATTGTALVDGRLNDPDWQRAEPIVRIRPEAPDSTVTVRMLAGDDGLRIGADIRDPYLAADGEGAGRGDRWQFDQDDAIQFFFDVNEGRSNQSLPATGRMLAYNFGKANGVVNRARGVVTRWEMLRGGGPDGYQPVTQDGTLYTGLTWSNRKVGSINKNSDVDTGWTTEVFIPWGALGLSGKPANGRTIGMNFRVIYDDGGERPHVVPALPDFADAAALDGFMTAVASSLDDDPRTGWPRPVGYAALQFVDSESTGAMARPRPIGDLRVEPVSGYAADLYFAAPAGTLAAKNRNKGHSSGYEVRISTTGPITSEAAWAAAASIENNFVPKLRGGAEKLRVGGLSPGTMYYAAVRATDAAGRRGALGNSFAFTMQTVEEDSSGGSRIMASPMGGQLQTESGEAFVIVGGTVSADTQYVRRLYTGLQWTPGSDEPVVVGSRIDPDAPAQYFDSLAATGVNTLRIQLEWIRPDVQGLSTEQILGHLPDGIRWLQKPGSGAEGETELNPRMREFLSAMMAEAARTGIRLILQTFNNFNYFATYGEQDFPLLDTTPFSAVNGGPLHTTVVPGPNNTQKVYVHEDPSPDLASTDPIREFFTNSTVLQMSKDRLTELARWVREDPNGHSVMGFELYNEWDDFKGTTGRTEATRVRALFVKELATHMRQVAPELLVFSTTIGPTPTGPVGRAVYYSDWFDVLHPHFYTAEVSQPANNPDADKAAKAASAYAAIGSYWLFNRRDNRPVHNGEWDLANPEKWPDDRIYYTGFTAGTEGLPRFTLAEDEANFRAASWVSIATGLAGQGLRIGSRVLPEAAYPEGGDQVVPVPLSPGMRGSQRAIARFVQAAESNGFQFARFNAAPLAGRISAIAAGSGGGLARAYGAIADDQLLAYVRLNNSTSATGGQLRIDGLEAGATRHLSVWSTDADPLGVRLLSEQVVIAGANGRLVLALPGFVGEVMVVGTLDAPR